MPAPKGHIKYNDAFNTKLFTPEEFWSEFMKYVDWCIENPIIQQVPHVKTGTIDIQHKRPYSIEGFCNFVSITAQTFYNYSKADGYETFFDVCARIKQVIDVQHFEGGMVGMYNANIVTRKLGLKEQSDITSAGNELKAQIIVQNKSDATNLDKL